MTEKCGYRMKTNTHFIAQYIVDMTNIDDVEIINNDLCVTLVGGLNNECYFQECASNADINTILGCDYAGKPTHNMKPGIYRITVGGICDGSEYDTVWGREYDSWEEYEILSVYKYTDDEQMYVLRAEQELDNGN